jgi:hypothetical protein
MESVYSAVRTEDLNKAVYASSLKEYIDYNIIYICISLGGKGLRYYVYRIAVEVRFGPSINVGGIFEVLALAKAEEPVLAPHSAATSVS